MPPEPRRWPDPLGGRSNEKRRILNLGSDRSQTKQETSSGRVRAVMNDNLGPEKHDNPVWEKHDNPDSGRRQTECIARAGYWTLTFA